MNQHSDREYHERRAEQHLQLASHASAPGVRDRHLNMAARHATLASLIGDQQVSAEATQSAMGTAPNREVGIEAWRTDYNTVRPHSSLGGMAPAEFTNRPSHGHEDTEANLSAA